MRRYSLRNSKHYENGQEDIAGPTSVVVIVVS